MAILSQTHTTIRLFAAVVLIAATACSPLSRLRHAQENDRGDFRSNLAIEYLSFAESEHELGHKETSRYFARKGLRAAHDHATPPEDPATWEVEENILTELKNNRERLMQVRSEFFQRVSSQTLARAQMLYDCWVMQAAENTDDDLSLPCRSEFLGELGKLEWIVGTLGPNPKVTLPAHYTILFRTGDAQLDKNAEFTVQEVLAITRLYPFYTIDITGHTDRVGSRERNLVLSTERAANTAAALVDAGIDPERIGFSAEGEDNPTTPTLDGVARERNRRVEIAVLPLMKMPDETATIDEGNDNAQ
jgi:outer membrane protein OmpA-like peptidoglycan-associated protein